MRIDSHVHVWSLECPDEYPTQKDKPLPEIPGSYDQLIKEMDATKVDMAVLVQPINYLFDHKYLRHSLKKYPNRFVGVGLVDLGKNAESAIEMVRQFAGYGFRGLRINPGLLREGQTVDGDIVTKVVREAGSLGLVVNLFVKPDSFEAVGRLMDKCDVTDVVIDHFGFCSPDEQEPFDKLLILLKKHPRLCVKASAFFRCSNESEWPYKDMFPLVNELVETIGAQRILWGTDFPFVRKECGYLKASSLVDEMNLNEADKRWMMGNSAARLYGVLVSDTKKSSDKAATTT